MERITKILLLTMLLTLSITSTCFASYNNGEMTDNQLSAIQNWIATEYAGTQYAGNAYWISRYQTTNYRIDVHDKATLVGSFNPANDGIELTSASRRYVRLSTGSDGAISVTKIDGGDGASTQTAWISSSDNLRMYYSSTNFYDIDGNQIFPELPEEEDPDIGGDIMGGETTLSFPDHEYTYWEGVIHQNNGATYAVLLVSNDPFSADNFLYRKSSGDTPDVLRFSASSSDEINYLVRTYVLQPDGNWLFGSGSSYTGTSMAHNLNVGNILVSTKDIENEDGTIFFPVTPAVPLEKLGLEIVGTMAKIAIVAVSCLVLLISLQVLWKVLKIYLV